MTWVLVILAISIGAGFFIRSLWNKVVVVQTYPKPDGGWGYRKVSKTSWHEISLSDGTVVKGLLVYNSRIARLITKMAAITIWNRIYVKGMYISDQGLKHELVHVWQWKKMGPFKFLTTYFKEQKKGYECNALEEEARKLAGEPLRCKN